MALQTEEDVEWCQQFEEKYSLQAIKYVLIIFTKLQDFIVCVCVRL